MWRRKNLYSDRLVKVNKKKRLTWQSAFIPGKFLAKQNIGVIWYTFVLVMWNLLNKIVSQLNSKSGVDFRK